MADRELVTEAIEKSWTRWTSADPEQWEERNPAWGQCAVTTMVLHALFGGAIKRGMVGRISHYWNEINGEDIDLTKKQFAEGSVIDPSSIEYRTFEYLLLNDNTKLRYHRLLIDTINYLINDNIKVYYA